MLSGTKGFDEDRIVQGYNGDGLLDYDAGVIQQLETVDEVLKYNVLAPFSDDSLKLTNIIYNIQNGRDVTGEESDFLDSIDSRFIGHSNKNDLTKREILCWFLNQFWDWSSLELPKTKDVNVSFRGLFSAYVQFCEDNSINRNTRRLKRSEFEGYLEHYGYIKRTQKTIAGEKRAIKVILDLPSYRQDLKEIPEFDLRVYFDKK